MTPRLEQECRADFVRQTNSKLFSTWNFDNSKGLELIPERHIELVFNLPPYFVHQAPEVKDGFGDVSFSSKYRFFARNEEHGNVIITGFLSGTVPTGHNGNGSCCATATPTLAVGKGFGLLALTSTAGGSLPASNRKKLGHTISWNSVAQYRLAHEGAARFFWPEVEINSSLFVGGPNNLPPYFVHQAPEVKDGYGDHGKSMTFATPGMIIGRIPLSHDSEGKPGRLGFTFGAGEQIALTHFHTYNHGIVITARLPF